MIKLRKRDERCCANHGRLDTYQTFSRAAATARSISSERHT